MFVLNCVDGCIPSDLGTGTSEEIEEERRLLYVAMTRAKDALHLVMPQRFYVHGQAARGDRHVYAARTRFIEERMLAAFEQVAWPAAVSFAGRRGRAAAARRPQGPHARHVALSRELDLGLHEGARHAVGDRLGDIGEEGPLARLDHARRPACRASARSP